MIVSLSAEASDDFVLPRYKSETKAPNTPPARGVEQRRSGMPLTIVGGGLRLVREVPIPDPVFALGPVVFQLGLLTLLVLRVVARRLPVWSPVLVLLGFVPIAVNLDLNHPLNTCGDCSINGRR
jgi:hypothetical protein